MKKWFVLIGCSVLLAGCALLQALVQQPTVTFDSVSMKDMSLTDGTAVFRFQVTNPNPVGLDLDSLAYRLAVDGRELVKGDLKQGLSLPAKGVQAVELPIRINYLDFFNSVADLLQKDKLGYDLSGTFGFGLLQIPYSQQGVLDIPRLPRVALKKATIRELSLTGAEMILQLEMANQNDFAMVLRSLDYGIKIGGVQLAAGKTAALKPLDNQGRQVLEIPVRLDFLTLGQTAYRMLQSGSAAYEITGSMGVDVPKIGVKAVPFSRNGQVAFRSPP
ncbi:MAG: LEA type 2 family protein [Thermodesulfobacteriota bacterium]